MSASNGNPLPSNECRGKASLLRWLLLAFVALVAFAWWAYETTDPVFGRFEGDVVTKWITDDLEMELVTDFNYIDPSGKRWTAPTGSIINGASIPSMFWSVIGGPFEGRFRKASVSTMRLAMCKPSRGKTCTGCFTTPAAARASASAKRKRCTGPSTILAHAGRQPVPARRRMSNRPRPTRRSSPRPSVTSTRNSSRPKKSKSAPSRR